MIVMTFPGLLLLLYFLGFLIELVNNAAMLSLSMHDTKIGPGDLSTVDKIKIIFFVLCWPVGLVIKAMTALDYFGLILGKLEEMDSPSVLRIPEEPETHGAIVGDGDPVELPRLTGYETVRLSESMLEDL